MTHAIASSVLAEVIVSPDDFVLMLNLGWSLQEIADQAGIPVVLVQQVIIARARLDRLMERGCVSA